MNIFEKIERSAAVEVMKGVLRRQGESFLLAPWYVDRLAEEGARAAGEIEERRRFEAAVADSSLDAEEKRFGWRPKRPL